MKGTPPDGDNMEQIDPRWVLDEIYQMFHQAALLDDEIEAARDALKFVVDYDGDLLGLPVHLREFVVRVRLVLAGASREG